MCDAIARTLGRRGFYVETVGTGGDALALLRSVKFGLALLDLQLPDMSGLEVARQLGARRATPCVLISGFLDASVEAEARALGIERVIEKPLAIDDVVATVGAAFPD
jgi:DNA-binding response OmpR family regulator